MGDRSFRLGWILLLWSARFLLPDLLNAADIPATPIQAELVERLDAEKVLVGASVLARVQLGWTSASCNLRPGDIVQGRIVFQKPYSKVDKTSEIAILFDKAQCGEPALKPFPLTVAAIVSADRQRDPALQPSEEHQLSDAVGVTLNGNTRSVGQAADTVGPAPGRTLYASPQRAAPANELRAGQVVGIAHLRLLVGKGPEGGSVLSSTGRVLRLNAGTQFVLFPSVAADTGAPRKEGAATVAPNRGADARPPLPDPTDITDDAEVCVPPSCQVAVDTDVSLTETRRAEFTLPLHAFGYLPPSATRDMLGFDYHAGVAFLGQGRLLFTFDPHLLVKRTTTEAISFSGLRIIRAVVVDLATKKVVKSVDWRIADTGQYFWPLGGEQVLVHVGDELRVYGPGLEQRKKISLGAPLAFVRQSPSSAFLAVGVIHERHTPAIHRQLQEAEGRDPEEDIEVRVLDSAFHPITTIMRSSRQAFPVLLDDGEVRVLKIAAGRWRIVKNSWAGERRVLAQASSSCLPSVQSLPDDLLFVVGCNHRTDKWYRILRDKKVLLKGSSSSAELEQTASGMEGGNLFLIGIAQAKQSLPWGTVFRMSDLKSERIVLYSTKTGQRRFAVTVSPVVPAMQMFAISPREDELAVLTTDRITLYRISTDP